MTTTKLSEPFDEIATRDELLEQEFQVVGRRGPKKRVNSESLDSSEPKRYRVGFKVRVTIQSKHVNLGMVNPIKISKWIGECVENVDKIKATYYGLLVICGETEARRMKRELKMYEGKSVQVEVEMPKKTVRGVLYRVHEEVTEQEIMEEHSEIEKVDFVIKGGQKTGTVFLTFAKFVQVKPESVTLGYQTYKCNEYYPQPVRCYRCQRFGHMGNQCHGKPRCSKCGGEHEWKECKEENMKCCNCGEAHSAAYKGCSKFEDEKKILEVKTKQKVSYAQAVEEVKGPQAEVNMVPETQMSQDEPPVNTPSLVKIDETTLTAIIVKLFYLFKKDVFVIGKDRIGQILSIVNKIGDFEVDREEVQILLDS